MTHLKQLCGVKLSSLGLLTVIFYLIDKSLASLDGYIAGEDYPAFTEVPKGLSFTCDDKIPGYYADPETMCQVWHWCVPGLGGNQMYSFICAPGTAFNQRNRVCDWFFKVDCPNSASYYGINEDLYKDGEGNYINGKNKPVHNTQRNCNPMRGLLSKEVLLGLTQMTVYMTNKHRQPDKNDSKPLTENTNMTEDMT